MAIITGRAPPPARSESYRSKGSRELINQVYQRIACEAIRGASRAAITAMKNHRGHRTRPSTMSTDNGERTAICLLQSLICKAKYQFLLYLETSPPKKYLVLFNLINISMQHG